MCTTFTKSYSWFTSIEYGVLVALALFGIDISFSNMQMLKAIVSFIFFILDIVLLRKGSESLPKLRYLLGSWKNLCTKGQLSCHAWMSVDDKIYHSTLDAGVDATTVQTMFGLSPKQEMRSLMSILQYRFFAPCVGFALPEYVEKSILQKLKNCGKCHDFAALTIYYLSCHKFLSYSVMAYVRWMNWIVFASACICHCIIYELRHDIALSRADSLLQNISMFIDALHILITVIDVLNIRDERLEDNNWSARDIFYLRGFCGELIKLLVLLVFMAIWITIAPPQLRHFGYYGYLLGCFVIGFFVHLVVMFSSKFSDVKNVKIKSLKKHKK